MIRKHSMLLVSILLSVICVGCETMPSTQAAQQQEVTYVANFNYTPPSQAAPGSAGVTFAVANIAYQAHARELKPWCTYPQFDNLGKAAREDLTKILTAKGFSIRGPFDSYDLIPYQDKKAIDLYLRPTIELLDIPSEEVYHIDDIKFRFSGRIILEVRDLFARELIWSKSIPFKEFEVPFYLTSSALVKWAPPFDHGTYDGSVKMKVESAGMSLSSANDAVKEIEKQYPELMNTIWKLIDPEEMRIIKKQAQELKSKKGY